MTIKYVDLLLELESLARQSDDAALACEAAEAAHRPEFDRCIPSEAKNASAESHARALELYTHVITNRHEAERLRREATILREAVERLKRYRETLVTVANANRQDVVEMVVPVLELLDEEEGE